MTAFALATFIIALALAWVPYVLGHTGQQAVDQSHNLANKISIACSNHAILSQLEQLGACQAAAQIQSTVVSAAPGTPGRNGSNGENGENGQAGRGIRNTNISDGHLFITYTDNATVDLGVIVGKNGATGKTGATGTTGVGITGTMLGGPTNTDLIVSRSDGTSTDVGTVVGKDGINGVNGTDGTAGTDGSNGNNGSNGRSVVSVQIDDHQHLIVTYDDGTNSDAGQVPAGPQGPQGVGVQSVTTQLNSDGTCDLVFTLFDPDKGNQTTQNVPVNATLCATLSSPTTTTDAPPPTTTDTPGGP